MNGALCHHFLHCIFFFLAFAQQNVKMIIKTCFLYTQYNSLSLRSTTLYNHEYGPRFIEVCAAPEVRKKNRVSVFRHLPRESLLVIVWFSFYR